MSFPNFPGKHEHDAFFSPQEYLEYLRQLGVVPDFALPEGVIFCFQNSLLRHVRETHATEPVTFFAGEFYLLPELEGRVGVSGGFGIGAPVVTTILEELVALGRPPLRQHWHGRSAGEVSADRRHHRLRSGNTR